MTMEATKDTTFGFRPDQAKYTIRCFIDAGAVLLLSTAFAVFISIMVLAKEGSAIPLLIFGPPTALAWIIAASYIPFWVRSVRYELTEEEIIVYKGVFSTIHKIVPYRTVTNVSIRRGFLDRIWLGLGTVNVQTAGAGGTSIAEERLVGLTNFEEIRDDIITNLRRYRADTGPALGGGKAGSKPTTDTTVDASQAMVDELRAIRELLEKRESQDS